MPHVLVPLAPGCEELEAITIIDLLVRAEINVTSCGLHDGPVTASRGTVIVPSQNINTLLDEQFDMIVLPGGLPGADHLRDDERIQTLLKNHAANKRYIAAICAAPKALAQAGLLHDKKATSYPGVLAALSDDNITITTNSVEIDDNIITSRGPGTAMDFALTLIEILAGKNKRDEVEQQLVR